MQAMAKKKAAKAALGNLGGKDKGGFKRLRAL